MTHTFKPGDEVVPMSAASYGEWTRGKTYWVACNMSDGSPYVKDDKGRIWGAIEGYFAPAPTTPPAPSVEAQLRGEIADLTALLDAASFHTNGVEAKLRAWIVEKANHPTWANSSSLMGALQALTHDVLGEELRIETRREVVLVKEEHNA
jgi:hypothetical protein